MRKFCISGLLTVFMLQNVYAATITVQRKIDWNQYVSYEFKKKVYPNFVTFSGAVHLNETNSYPLWAETIRLNTKAKVKKVEIKVIQAGRFNHAQSIQAVNELNKLVNYNQKVVEGTEQNKSLLVFSFVPILKQGGEFLPITAFELIIEYNVEQVSTKSFSKKPFVNNSVLQAGNWYKLAVTKTGFHRLTKNFFDQNGINLNGVDPRTIQIFGNGPGILPQANSISRIDDLKENAILVQGEQDGVFGSSDYVIFYGKSQYDVWYNNGSWIERQKNIYSDTTYYYLTFSQQNGKRITKQNSVPIHNLNQTTHTFVHSHEQELLNQGKTGRQFLGEAFDRVPSQNFSVYIDGFIPDEPIVFKSLTAAKTTLSDAYFDVSANGNTLFRQAIGKIGTGYEDPYYLNSGLQTATFSSTTPQVVINYQFSLPPGGALGWLDYFELNAKSKLTWYNSQPIFRINPTDTGFTRYTISDCAGTCQLFNVTNTTEVTELLVTDEGNRNISAVNKTTGYTEFCGISNSTSYWVPICLGRVTNQNLHGLAAADGVYLAPGIFMGEALRLAEFYENLNGLKIHVININDVYNEFSSGAQDISAIRDFLRMFYLSSAGSSNPLKFVTFWGRASYDYKYRTPNNSNFIPSFQSPASESPLTSYCSDDYYGFLDENEGNWESANDKKEFLDIGIGRLPISNTTEAANAVNKIISYHQAETQADWRNRITFVADDGDRNLHQRDADIMANKIRNDFKNYNVKKIWCDAYPREVIAGGERYPQAQKAIVDAVQKGNFIVNYTGHGGELGWAAERILTIEDINNWTNANRLALFVTATCEFSRFDDPGRVSAGELTFLNNRGGAIALFTTVRLVSAYYNTLLNTAFYRWVGLDSTSKTNPRCLGQIMQLTKNDYLGNDKNERNFALLGDAAMYLAYPKKNVSCLKINNIAIAPVTDTLKALSKVKIEGEIQDLNGSIMNQYNGIVYPTIFDKPTTYQTMGNPGNNPINFVMQDNIIYSGQASVNAGKFTFQFIVTKDISYQIGKGKISFYAQNGTIDANGFNENFLVGGTNENALADDVGPQIKLFFDDDKFVPGGVTSSNTLFIAQLFDENGINTIGRGIGRELLLVVDNNTQNSIPLNEFYKGNLDNYQAGEVRYPLASLSSGKHSVTLRAWDNYNNSSEASIDFVVESNEELAIKNVLNYPNPFTTNTTFHFDHNQAGKQMQVNIQVFTISGKLVKTLYAETTSATSHFSDLSWNAQDDFGDKLAKGVYLYKVTVKVNGESTAQVLEKLVILN